MTDPAPAAPPDPRAEILRRLEEAEARLAAAEAMEVTLAALTAREADLLSRLSAAEERCRQAGQRADAQAGTIAGLTARAAAADRLQAERDTLVAALATLDPGPDGTPPGDDPSAALYAVGRTLTALRSDLAAGAAACDRQTQAATALAEGLHLHAAAAGAAQSRCADAAGHLAAALAASTSAADGVERLGAEARGLATEGHQAVSEAVAVVDRIEEGSARIGKIIDLIEGIAFQTNLLALNAGVEAARAGEAGRGFAVVASEVRALAQRSTDASRQIGGLIRDSNSHVRDGAARVRAVGATLSSMVTAFDGVTEAIGQIVQGNRDQAAILTELGAATGEMGVVAQTAAALAGQAQTAAANPPAASPSALDQRGTRAQESPFSRPGGYIATPPQQSGRPPTLQTAAGALLRIEARPPDAPVSAKPPRDGVDDTPSPAARDSAAASASRPLAGRKPQPTRTNGQLAPAPAAPALVSAAGGVSQPAAPGRRSPAAGAGRSVVKPGSAPAGGMPGASLPDDWDDWETWNDDLPGARPAAG